MRIVRYRLSNNNKMRGALLVLLTVLLIGLIPLEAAFAAATDVDIPYNQSWTNFSESNVNDRFEYRLTSTDGSPLPSEANGEYYSFTAEGSEKGDLKLNFPFSKPGYYNYRVKQYVSDKQKGYKYDGTAYDIMIMVVNDTTGIKVGAITIQDQDLSKYSELSFVVSYGKEGGDDPDDGDDDAGDGGGGGRGGIPPDGGGQPPPGQDTTQPIDDTAPPESGPLGIEIDHWALLNLILMILSVLIALTDGFLYFMKPRDKYGDEYESEEVKRHGLARILAIVLAIISVIVFVFTEDIRLPMEWVDEYTIWMVILFIATVVMTMMSKKEYDEDGYPAEA